MSYHTAIHVEDLAGFSGIFAAFLVGALTFAPILHITRSLDIRKEGCQTEHQAPWFPNRSGPVMPKIWARLWAVIPSQLFCVVRRCAPNWRTGPAGQQLQFQVVDFGWGSDPNMRFSNTKPGTGSLSCILHAAFVKLKCAIVKTLGWWVIWLIFFKGRSLWSFRVHYK